VPCGGAPVNGTAGPRDGRRYGEAMPKKVRQLIEPVNDTLKRVPYPTGNRWVRDGQTTAHRRPTQHEQRPYRRENRW
jgi:hypothetical protein